MDEQTSNGANENPNPLDNASTKVKSFINSNNLEGLKEYLNGFNKEDQSRIVNHVEENYAPFFLACLKGREDIVKYMLLECSVDIELRGLYVLVSESFNEKVTPLWVAVSEQHLSVVKLLVAHGSDIHATTSTNSTPVRCACYCMNLAIVKYLVENGANIHQPNVYGGTCLMNATKGSVELCEFLVNNGASVNATTTGGYTALYHAIKSGRLDLVKLFLNAGASHFVTITTEVHILHLAAIHGNRTIFDYIKDNSVMKLSRLLDGYELLGATMIDDFDNIPDGLELWKKAIDLRYANPEAPLTKNIPDETKRVYRFHRETATPEQCKSLVASDKDRIYMHALLARERILGTRHERTIHEILYRGAVYADSLHYQRAVDLWKYAYILRRQALPAKDEDFVSDLSMFVDLFKEMFTKSSSGQISEKVQTGDIVDVFGIMVDQLEEFTDVLVVRPLQKDTFKTFRALLVIIIDFMQLFYRSECQSVESQRFTNEVKRVIKLDAASEQGEQLLHLALMTRPEKVDVAIPDVDLIRCLIKTGACVNAMDKGRNSPLHHCISSWHTQLDFPGRADQWKGLAWLLIENGAHIDARNCKKETPMEFLMDQGCVCPLKYTTLKCMAAVVIVNTSMEYHGYLPSSLKTFVQLHE
ncbi:protein fem-1 homolog CG6966-like [Pecten maximus]|uniref:protein fem-1 homolog CG6966-like n=1 Tax=Pecten maximus TaxID=6579 RepID=UPI001458FA0E|nr:protein fem-1 homolog CG6966-like [Pecten maximus]